jgi:hypothetical protein
MKIPTAILAGAIALSLASGASAQQTQQTQQTQTAQPTQQTQTQNQNQMQNQAPQNQSTLTLYQGAQINGRLRSAIDSGSAHVGDRFIMDVVPPYPSGNPAFQGGIIAGEITSVTHAGQGSKPSLGMQFDYLRLADGSTVDISATMTQDQRKQEQGNGAHALLTTVGGMLLGNAIGKTIFHTGGGGVVGAAGGLLYGLNQKTNFSLPVGSNVQITLNQTVTIRRQIH